MTGPHEYSGLGQYSGSLDQARTVILWLGQYSGPLDFT